MGHAEQSSTYYLQTSPILSNHPQPPPPPLKKKRVNGQASSLSTDTFKNAEVIIKFSQSIAYRRLSTLLKDRMSQLA